MVTDTRNEDAASAIACTLGDRELAARSEEVRRELFAGVIERRELPDGYAYRFPGDATWRERIEAFADAERQCCAFFTIDIAPDASGSLWLTLTGPDGTKAFIETVFATQDQSF